MNEQWKLLGDVIGRITQRNRNSYQKNNVDKHWNSVKSAENDLYEVLKLQELTTLQKTSADLTKISQMDGKSIFDWLIDSTNELNPHEFVNISSDHLKKIAFLEKKGLELKEKREQLFKAYSSLFGGKYINSVKIVNLSYNKMILEPKLWVVEVVDEGIGCIYIFNHRLGTISIKTNKTEIIMSIESFKMDLDRYQETKKVYDVW